MTKAKPASIAALVLALTPATALACDAGGEACPIPVHMKAGTDTITLVNRLQPNTDCCYYSLEASAGQTLTWAYHGPGGMRSVIDYPDGSADGPGIPNSIPLKTTGTYVLGIVPDLMADDSTGPFRLTVTIK